MARHQICATKRLHTQNMLTGDTQIQKRTNGKASKSRHKTEHVKKGERLPALHPVNKDTQIQYQNIYTIKSTDPWW